MGKVSVLIEMDRAEPDAFALHAAMMASPADAVRTAETLVADLAGFGLEIVDDYPAVPMFSGGGGDRAPEAIVSLHSFGSSQLNPDMPAGTMVLQAEVDRSRLSDLRNQPGVRVWANSELTLFHGGCPHCGTAGHSQLASAGTNPTLGMHPFDAATSRGGVDCSPFKPAVPIEVIRQLLGVDALWRDGFRGQNVIVGIIDEGVNGVIYPVVGGYSAVTSRQPGSALITSHGSMCAADILVAAPAARLYDYPFLGVPNSGGALRMFQAVLDQRRKDGTPHLTNNSYGFVAVPPKEANPDHEIHDLNHPLHRKVREVVASGAPAFFAAGNCGEDCPSGACFRSGIGPRRSIHASNSLAEVVTVAAVNHHHDRIGYSSQGPGMFEKMKPDVAAYSHFFGNFGPGRPAGGDASRYDNGTSAATPIAAGVGALLLSAFPRLLPGDLKRALIRGATDLGIPGWDTETGHGAINAAAAYAFLLNPSRFGDMDAIVAKADTTPRRPRKR